MKIAMMFPGYGSQYVGMGKEFYDSSRLVQELFEEASSCLDINFVKLCFASSDAELSEMRHAYVSIFLISASIAAVLREKKIRPSAVAGFNHGTFAALYAVDSLSLPDGLYLLNKFAHFYAQHLSGNEYSAISVVGLSSLELQNICTKAEMNGHRAYIALYETDTRHVVIGHTKAVNEARDAASTYSSSRDITIEYVDLAVGLHSELAAPIADEFKAYLHKVDFHNLSSPLIESMSGKVLQDGSAVAEHIVERIVSPIMWPQIMKKLTEYDLVISIGPGTELRDWLQDFYPDTQIICINKPEDLVALAKLVQQQDKSSIESKSNEE